MPTEKLPAAPVVGGFTSRRHAKLLHHLFDASNGGASANAPVKDLRIRRVVPPASAPPPDASPDPPAAAKPMPAVVEIQVAQSTPPEPTAAAAAQDRERKPVSLIYSSPFVHTSRICQNLFSISLSDLLSERISRCCRDPS
jgi:hypothetical protein